jgi:hypothetical protein
LHICLIQRFINSLDPLEHVHRVSLFQGVYDQTTRTLPFDISITEGTKAFALNKQAHLIISDKFKSLIRLVNSDDWSKSHKFAVLLTHGIHLPAHSKDFIFDECLRAANILSLHWNIGLAEDIGFIGQGGSVWRNLESKKIRLELEDFDSQNALMARIRFSFPLIRKENEDIAIRRALFTEEAVMLRGSIKSVARHLIRLLIQNRKKLINR